MAVKTERETELTINFSRSSGTSVVADLHPAKLG